MDNDQIVVATWPARAVPPGLSLRAYIYPCLPVRASMIIHSNPFENGWTKSSHARFHHALFRPHNNQEAQHYPPRLLLRTWHLISTSMISAKFLHSTSRVVPGRAGAVARFVSSTPSAWNPSDENKNILQKVANMSHLRLRHSIEPVPYTSGIELTPTNTGTEKLGHQKVTVVGCGQVGMAIAYSMLNQVTAGTIALVDMNKDKLEGEAKDLEQGSAFHQYVRILASDEYSVSQDSNLVIITAGAAQKPGESRLNLLERNIGIMKNIIPKVLTFSPDASICIVANPVDIMTAVAAKIGGPSIPPGRIFGSGTCLDSSRLRSLISKKLDLDASAVTGYVIGEHGDSSVPVWSSVRVGGVPLLNPGEEPTTLHDSMHNEVVMSAYDVIQKKGYTNWAVGLTGSHIARAVVDDTRQVMPLSTCVRGLYGIEQDIFTSMPCVVGSTGIRRVLELPLTDSEKSKLLLSTSTLWGMQKDIWEKV